MKNTILTTSAIIALSLSVSAFATNENIQPTYTNNAKGTVFLYNHSASCTYSSLANGTSVPTGGNISINLEARHGVSDGCDMKNSSIYIEVCASDKNCQDGGSEQIGKVKYHTSEQHGSDSYKKWESSQISDMNDPHSQLVADGKQSINIEKRYN